MAPAGSAPNGVAASRDDAPTSFDDTKRKELLSPYQHGSIVAVAARESGVLTNNGAVSAPLVGSNLAGFKKTGDGHANRLEPDLAVLAGPAITEIKLRCEKADPCAAPAEGPDTEIITVLPATQNLDEEDDITAYGRAEQSLILNAARRPCADECTSTCDISIGGSPSGAVSVNSAPGAGTINDRQDIRHGDMDATTEPLLKVQQDQQEQTIAPNSRRRVYFRNITKWGPKAVEFLKDNAKIYDLIGFVESHLPAERIEEVINVAHDLGYKVALTPARQKGEAALSGGCVMAARGQHHTTSFRHLAISEAQAIGARYDLPFAPGPLDFWDFVPVCLRMKGFNLTLIGTYLDTQKEGAPLSANNKVKLALLGGFIRAVKGLWCAAGDWNRTPQELANTGWLEQVSGSIICPSNTDFTSYAGAGRMLDYIVVARGTECFFLNLIADDSSMYSAHKGLDLTLEAEPVMAPVRTLRMPKPFAHPPVPPKLPCPDSKRTALRAEWALLHGGKIAAAVKAQVDRHLAKQALLQKTREARKQGLAPPTAVMDALRPADMADLFDFEDEPLWNIDEEAYPEGPEDWCEEATSTPLNDAAAPSGDLPGGGAPGEQQTPDDKQVCPLANPRGHCPVDCH